MEPYDSPAEAAFRAEARTWLTANAPPHSLPPIAPSAIVAEWDAEREQVEFERAVAWQRTKFDAGWAGVA